MTGESIHYNILNEEKINKNGKNYVLTENVISFIQKNKENNNIYFIYSINNGEDKYNKFIPINDNQIFALERVFNKKVSDDFLIYWDTFCNNSDNTIIDNLRININMIDNFLKNGADPDIKQSNGKTCLHLVCSLNRPDIAELLLNNYANPMSKTFSNITPLHLSVKQYDNKITKLLLKYEIDINAKDSIGWTPAFYAAWNKDIDNLKILIEYKADLNIGSTSNWTPIHVVCNSRHNLINNIKLLINNNVDINVKDDKGITPLFVACLQQNENIVELLIQNGADPNLKTNNKLTALQYCQQCNYYNLINFFNK